MLRLTSTDRTIYAQALDQLRPLNIPLNLAVLEYTSAVKHLPDGATLKEAVDFFRRRNPATLEKRTVRQFHSSGDPTRRLKITSGGGPLRQLES